MQGFEDQMMMPQDGTQAGCVICKVTIFFAGFPYNQWVHEILGQKYGYCPTLRSMVEAAQAKDANGI